jgi:hypothetical protein
MLDLPIVCISGWAAEGDSGIKSDYLFFFWEKKKKSSHIEASLKPAMTLIILHTRVQVP